MNNFRRLSPAEREAWRAIVEFCGHITNGADVDVLRHGLSGSDYEVLVRLADAGTEGIRMSELAALVLVSKSRLTYRIDRMERRGLVTRRVCDTDRRGFIAEITEHGAGCPQRSSCAVSQTPRVGFHTAKGCVLGGCGVGVASFIVVSFSAARPIDGHRERSVPGR